MLDLGRIEIERERLEQMAQDIQNERVARSVAEATHADRYSWFSRLLVTVGGMLTDAGTYLQDRYGVINEQAANACNVKALEATAKH